MSNWSVDDLDLTASEAQKESNSMKEGRNPCRIAACSAGPNKAGNGGVMKVEFLALDGSGKTTDYITYKHTNPQADKIGKERLKGLCLASQHPSPNRPNDVKAFLGLQVGVICERDEPWTDDTGKLRQGGIKPKKSGAYYPLELAEKSAGEGASGAPAGDNFDDDIPF